MTRYEFWSIRDGAPYRRLRVPEDSVPSITWTAQAEIKRSITLECAEDSEVDWLTDLLAVYRITSEGRVGLGLFVVTTCPVSINEAGIRTVSLTGYDQGYILRDLSKLEYTITIRAGTKYTDAIREQLIAAGIKQLRITESPAVLPTDHAFELGTSRMEIVQVLLSEINYRSLWFDGDGTAICEPWVPAAVGPKAHIYEAGTASILCVPMEQSFDTFGAANVFIDVVSSADFANDLIAISENTDINSPLSVQRRKLRVPDVMTIDGISSREALQTHADNRKIKSMMSAASYAWYTGASQESEHGLNDSVVLQRDDIGLLEEQDWSIECVPGGRMKHTGKRVFYRLD